MMEKQLTLPGKVFMGAATGMSPEYLEALAEFYRLARLPVDIAPEDLDWMLGELEQEPGPGQ